LDPATVEKIDVVYDKYYVGGYIFQGIINVITKAGDFSAVTLPDNMVRIPYRSVDRVPAFILPDHGSDDREKSRLPDYRNTLYWNPSIGPDSPGHLRIECWTGDNPGKYVITIEGVDGEGNPVSAGKWVVVK